MQHKKTVCVILAVFIVFAGIGAAFVYFNGHGGYSASIKVDNGNVSFSVSGTDSELRYAVFSETSVPSHIYLYLDEGYASEFNTNYQQKEFFNVLKSMLERRNYTAVSFCNAQQLAEMMSSGEKSAVFFVSGAMPNTVSNDLFKRWMSSGGTVYWAGPEIGRYVSTHEKVVDSGKGYFDGRVNDKEGYAYTQSEMFRGTNLRYDVCDYGLSLDVENSLPLGYVNDKYSAVTAVKLFGGNAIIYGGNIANSKNISHELMDRTSCADLLICGLTFESSVVSCGSGKVSDGTFNAGSVAGCKNALLFIGVGSPATSWSIAKQVSG